MKTSWQTLGSYLAVMKLCLAVVVCLSAMGYLSVETAVCTTQTDLKCVATDFTLETCNNETKLCDCQLGYWPIPTGCGSHRGNRLMVRTIWDKTTEFIPGAMVTLTCDTPFDGDDLIEWRKDGQVVQVGPEATYGIYSLSGDGDKIGLFTCARKSCPETIVSDPVLISPVSAAGPSTPPVVASLPEAAAEGVSIYVSCMNIPYGATTTIKFGGNTTISHLVKNNASNYPVVCVLKDPPGMAFTRNKESAPQAWTTKVVADITSATIPGPGQEVHTSGTSVVLSCVTVPEEIYMVHGTKSMAYTFQDSLNPSTSLGVTGNKYKVLPMTGSHTITCTASYDGKPGKTSDPVTVTFSDDCLQRPLLRASQTAVKIGTRLVLTCGDKQLVKGITYLWTKNGIEIPGQKDRIIQYGNYSDSDAGTFICIASARGRLTTSNVVTITSSDGFD